VSIFRDFSTFFFGLKWLMQLSQPRSVAEMRMAEGGDRRKHHRLFVATRPCRAETGKSFGEWDPLGSRTSQQKRHASDKTKPSTDQWTKVSKHVFAQRG